jgi:transposase
VPNGRRPVTRGIARRNAKLAALRELVRKGRAVLAVDLASQRQAAVLCDHDCVVLARRMFAGSAWCISEVLAWAEPLAKKAGFAGVALACDPAGHRWKPLIVSAHAAGVPADCVQPLLVRRARKGEDFTRSRSDFGEAVIIARLAAELRCYDPWILGVGLVGNFLRHGTTIDWSKLLPASPSPRRANALMRCYGRLGHSA